MENIMPPPFLEKRTMRKAIDDALRLMAEQPKSYFRFLAFPVFLFSIITAVTLWIWSRGWLAHVFIPALAGRHGYPEDFIAALQHPAWSEIICTAGLSILWLFAFAFFLSSVVLQARAFQQTGQCLPKSFIATCKSLRLRIPVVLWALLKATVSNFTLFVLSLLMMFLPFLLIWMPTLLLGLVWMADTESALLGDHIQTPSFSFAFILCTAISTALSSLWVSWQIWTVMFKSGLPQRFASYKDYKN